MLALWAEMNLVPGALPERHRQLFADGSEVKHFAVASNQRDWTAPRLLNWQREKAGTIEALLETAGRRCAPEGR